MVGVTGRNSRNTKALRELRAAGNKAMQTGAFQKAIRLYTKALELDAGNAVLYSNRSAAHFNNRQFSEALEDAESAILCDNMWWKAYKRKGLALIHIQKYEEAIQALEQGLKIVGKNAEMEKNLEFAKACQEQAQNLYILPEPHMMQRLESVPVFIVTDNVGQPFFVTYDDGQQVCTFYFDKQDATATLEWIKSENPDLGDTARVIHITLHQAFNLAQETQKQYYEETTRAAAAEDRAAAEEAERKAKQVKEGIVTGAQSQANDIDDEPDVDDGSNEGDSKDVEEDATDDKNNEQPETQESTEGDTQALDENEIEETSENIEKEEQKPDQEVKENDPTTPDDIVGENAPLSFQFRPELRQVKVAVELLNKNPNPSVRPILRDPPSVRKAKVEAAAAASTGKEENEKEGKEVESETNVEATDADASVKESNENDEKKEEVENDKKDEQGKDTPALGNDDDDVELTVDNFNGIPIFQAKGLTFLQKNKQLIPLFFSKWDLEAAWNQLKESNTIDVPGECEIDVGTLEDVLRRMSESKTDEFESVFFVPSRESMKAINMKFPLDELAPPGRPGMSGAKSVKKAEFSKAKQIAARGGSKDEIRAAIKEDLDKLAERQRMAEIIAQIERARRIGGVGGVGNVGLGTGAINGQAVKETGNNVERKSCCETGCESQTMNCES